MIPLLILSVFILILFAYREHEHSVHLSERERAWDAERQILLNRIQHPNHIPVPASAPEPPAPIEAVEPELSEPDEIGLVGTIESEPMNAD